MTREEIRAEIFSKKRKDNSIHLLTLYPIIDKIFDYFNKKSISRDEIRQHILEYDKISPIDMRDFSFVDVFQIIEDILEELEFSKDTNYKTISDENRENILWVSK